MCSNLLSWPGLCESDNIKRMITLTVITLSGGYCIIVLLFLIFFEDHRIGKFCNNIDFRKLDFISEEKISERSGFVNKDVMQS